jgi:hypothetical protein
VYTPHPGKSFVNPELGTTTDPVCGISVRKVQPLLAPNFVWFFMAGMSGKRLHTLPWCIDKLSSFGGKQRSQNQKKKQKKEG